MGEGRVQRGVAVGAHLPPGLAASVRTFLVSFGGGDEIISLFPQNCFSCWVNSVFHFALSFLSVPAWLLSPNSRYNILDQDFFYIVKQEKWKPFEVSVDILSLQMGQVFLAWHNAAHSCA